jgi:hypothetical protein
MRAIAGTVQGAPPLRLTSAAAPSTAGDKARLQGHGARSFDPRRPGAAARPGSRGWRRHPRWSVLAPVAAAVTIVAVAIALAVVRNSPGGAVAPPPAGSASPAGVPTYTAAAGVPEYYVAWMQADTPYLIVGDTLTGQVRATVKAPDNVDFTGVYGTAGSDSTFLVTGNLIHSPAWDTVWYLLRIAPGTRNPVRLTPLAIADAGQPSPVGVALSPDGSEVAVALPGHLATLRVYSVATGALLHSWSMTVPGEITAEKVPPGSWQFTAMALRWSADGKQLGFAWNASAIRVLGASAPEGDLMARSRQLAAIGKAYVTEGSFTCTAAQGWQLVADGQGILCAGGAEDDRYSCAGATDGKCKFVKQLSIGFYHWFPDGQGGTESELLDGKSGCTRPQPVNGAYLGWANADGSVIIGSQACDGQSRFGIFRGSHFTALPALPVSGPVPAGVLAGTVAW